MTTRPRAALSRTGSGQYARGRLAGRRRRVLAVPIPVGPGASALNFYSLSRKSWTLSSAPSASGTRTAAE